MAEKYASSMPYIKPTDRDRLDCHIYHLGSEIETVGELNYAVTRLALCLLKRLGLNYSNISNIVGTLALVPVEIGRRLVSRYEDKKIAESGDVPEYGEDFWT